jgi:uncharacterized protein (DUF1684 family)
MEMFFYDQKNYKSLCCTIFLFGLLLIGCGGSTSGEDSEYITEIRTWQEQRIEGLKSENGWLNLAGLYWLIEGENSFGTAPSNDIVFPESRGPEQIGSFFLESGEVSVRIRPGVEVFHNNEPVESMQLRSDMDGDATMLQCGSLLWFVIRRGDQHGIRLRDLDSPMVDTFKGIDTFPIDLDWRVEAVLEPYDPPRLIKVPTILGTITEQLSPGALVFQIAGETRKLIPTGELSDEELFLVFADETSGHSTYGGGRFLYVETPGEDGRTIIDFNRAYNPPCAFTPYATCPLPPEQNRLPIEMTAGEKNYDHPSIKH